MKTSLARIAAIVFSALTLPAVAQIPLSGHLNGGLIFPFNDFTNNNFVGNKPDLFSSVGIGYTFKEGILLRGDFVVGNYDGDNKSTYYECSFFETNLSVQYDLIQLINKKAKIKISPVAGAGLVFYSSRGYDLITRAKIAESPNPTKKAISPNPILFGGLELGFVLTQHLDLNVGFTQRMVPFNDYVDTYKNGFGSDLYSFLNLGLTYRLGKKTDPSKVEVDKREYNDLRNSLSDLKQQAESVNPEKLAKLEMENQEKSMRIKALENELDSARAQVRNIETDNSQPQKSNPDVDAILGNAQYRIIVASLPTEAMAQRWIDRSDLDDSEMIIVYVEDINTYRVIYKSFDTYQAAKKELPEAKNAEPDAWIIKF